MGPILGVGLTNVVMAAILAVGAAVVGRLARKPALTHGLWLIVLVKLITPPLWSVSLALPASDPTAVEQALQVVRYLEVSESDLAALELVSADQGTFEAEVPAPIIPGFFGQHWQSLLGGAWALGTVCWLVSASLRISAFRRVVRLGKPAPNSIQDQSDAIAEKLGLAVSPEVWMTPGTISPLVWAIGGPARLLVPECLWKTLKHDQQCTLLTHELAHLKRHDHWVRWVELAATAVYWWCPVLWWARHELREAEEQCCDAWVVWAWPKAAKAYATALLETLDFLSETRPAVPLAASGAGHVRHLKRRLTMILSGLTPRSLSLAGKATLLGLSAILLPLVPTIAQEAKKQVEVRVERSEKPIEAKASNVGHGDQIEVRAVVVDDEKEGDKPAEKKDAAKQEGSRNRVYRIRTQDGKEVDSSLKTQLRVNVDIKAVVESLEKARAEAKGLERALEKVRAHIIELEAKVGRSGNSKQLSRVEIREVRVDGQLIREETGDGIKHISIYRLGPDGQVIDGKTSDGKPVVGRPPQDLDVANVRLQGTMGGDQNAKLMQLQKQLDELRTMIEAQGGNGAKVRDIKREAARAGMRRAELAEQARTQAEQIREKVEIEVREKLKEAEAKVKAARERIEPRR